MDQSTSRSSKHVISRPSVPAPPLHLVKTATVHGQKVRLYYSQQLRVWCSHPGDFASLRERLHAAIAGHFIGPGYRDLARGRLRGAKQ